LSVNENINNNNSNNVITTPVHAPPLQIPSSTTPTINRQSENRSPSIRETIPHSTNSHKKDHTCKKTKKYKASPPEGDEGYNSADEYGDCKARRPGYTCGQGFNEVENELLFEEELKKKKGFYIKRMKEDGNCLFRSIADQIYGDEEMHNVIRAVCMDYMEKERDHFSQFITEEFNSYIARKRMDKCYGNNVEMQAFAEIYGRPIEVYHGRGDAPMNIFHGAYKTDYPPIRLSYHRGNHYNSVIDPNNPSVGVGLGLPSYQPGLADRMQIMEAMKLSEQEELDNYLLEEFRMNSEMETIEREIEQAILAQSRAEYFASLFRDFQVPNTTTATSGNGSPKYNNFDYNNNNNNNSSSGAS
jgi:OTU domain-containing protein 5